jgi:hypothetical protein
MSTMSFSTFALDPRLVAFATVIALSSLVILVFSKGHRNAVLDRLRIRRRRSSGASTPPRSFSFSNKSSESTGTKEALPPSAPTLDFVNTFPPSRRSALLELGDIASSWEKEPSLDLHSLPTSNPYTLGNDPLKRTPTGFSAAEIKALGDFPAYDVLSGVPLPQPYQNFDPEKALPRPYRPFRWAYHQTMGKAHSNPVFLGLF